jgi:hypothetical protein
MSRDLILAHYTELHRPYSGALQSRRPSEAVVFVLAHGGLILANISYTYKALLLLFNARRHKRKNLADFLPRVLGILCNCWPNLTVLWLVHEAFRNHFGYFVLHTG